MDSVDVKAPGAAGLNSEDPCSWAVITAALRTRLAGLSADQRSDLRDFIQMVEGIAALDAQKNA